MIGTDAGRVFCVAVVWPDGATGFLWVIEDEDGVLHAVELGDEDDA